MSRYSLEKVLGSALLLASIISCRSLTVKVGHKSASSELQDVPATASEHRALYQSWNSMEDNVNRLEELKKEGAQSFLGQYKKQGRALLRSTFRQFRDSVVRNANTEHNYGMDLLGALAEGECRTLKNPSDVFLMDDYGDLRPLLETAILAKLSPSEASALHPSLAGSVDTLTKLIFFELGIKLDGSSHYAEAEGMQSMSSDIAMKVIHEQGENDDWKDADDKSFTLSMRHQKDASLSHSLRLEAAVGAGDQGQKAASSRDFLRFNYLQNASEQSLELQNGHMLTGVGESLVYSRRLALHPDPAVAHQFILSDTQRYTMPNASTRNYQFNFDRHELCAMKAAGTGKNPEPQSPAPKPTPKPEPKPANNPSQSSPDNPGQN